MSAAAEPLVRDLNFRRESGCTEVPREPVRDWRLGWMTGHRLRAIVFTTSVTTILLASHSLSPAGRPPQTAVEDVVSWVSLLWLGALLPGSLGLIGTLLYRFPTDLDAIRPINRMICWRIVTAGKNIDIVLSTIRRCRAEMAKTPLAPYLIEVVIDACDNVARLPAGDVDVRVIVVPPEYATPNKSRYKARALHYALFNSSISETAWIVHLDEETQPTQSAIKGVCKFIAEEEASGRLRIGQGALLYHREWKRHPFLTLADNVRTGDDLARFHLQHRLGVTMFGLHGSFIVVRNDVEKATGGFDFGPNGDITEDAFWAIKAMQNGLRCAWVDGFMEEQSCMSIVDFLRQRRRWFHGLVKTVLYAPGQAALASQPRRQHDSVGARPVRCALHGRQALLQRRDPAGRPRSGELFVRNIRRVVLHRTESQHGRTWRQGRLEAPRAHLAADRPGAGVLRSGGLRRAVGLGDAGQGI